MSYVRSRRRGRLNGSEDATSEVNLKDLKATTKKTIQSPNNNTEIPTSPSDTITNIQKEKSTTEEERERGESSSSTSSPAPLTNREKQILERREYRRKLAEDPSFVPYVGMFWSHDDRYRDDALRPALDSGPPSKKAQSGTADISERSTLMHRNSNRPTTTIRTPGTTDKNSHQQEHQRHPSNTTKFSKKYRRIPDEIINSKWSHDGYDWLLRMDEMDQQRKQDGSRQFRPSNRHYKQRREQRPSVSNQEDGANSNWQSFNIKNTETHGKLDKQEKKKDINEKNESLGDEKTKDNNNSSSNNGWDDTSLSSPKQADIISTDNDDWANTEANKNWKSFSLPTTDVWEASHGSTSALPPSKDDNKNKKNDKAASTKKEKPKEKEKGIAANGWNDPSASDTITDDQLQSAAAGWKSIHDTVKKDGWETETKAASCSEEKETEWSSNITIDNADNIKKEDVREEWGSIDTSNVEKEWSETAVGGWESDKTNNNVALDKNDGKNNASWGISSNEVDDTAKKHYNNLKKDELASAAWGAWDKTNSFNNKHFDQFQQPQQQQRRGRGYLSQKRPPAGAAAPAQQQEQIPPQPQQPQQKSLTSTHQESKSIPKKETQTVKKQEQPTSSTTSSSQPKPTPIYDFNSIQNAPWDNTTSIRDEVWSHNKFIEDKEDQESDVEIILEADDSLSTGWDGNDDIIKATTTTITTNIVVPPKIQEESEKSRQQTSDNIKQSRMDDNWRRREDPEPIFTTTEDTNTYSNNNNFRQQPPLPPNSYYYPQPMSNYMPIAAALPQAYGTPLQSAAMQPPQPQPVSAHDNNINNGQQQQFMPSAYEANGMVYYGMEPNMYQYYYYPPQPVPMPVQQDGTIAVDDDGDHEGWGATPPYEEDWEHNNTNFKQEHSNHHGRRQRKQQQQQQQQAFYYYPTDSSQYYT
ncbi:hypothetical protein BDC45DRAFT_232464 [Circinella umbellata]|nr:hypothetical protein BDC45DRAFT_232464 [Circinella umbellata]